MLTLMASTDNDVRKTALKVLAQVFDTEDITQVLDEGSVDLVAEAVMLILQDDATPFPLDTMHLNLQILDNIFPHLGEEMANKLCAESNLGSLISKLSQVETVGEKLFSKICRHPSFRSNDIICGNFEREDIFWKTHGSFGREKESFLESHERNERHNSFMETRRSNEREEGSFREIRGDRNNNLDTENNGECRNGQGVLPDILFFQENTGNKNVKSTRIVNMMKKMDDDEPMGPVEINSASLAGAQNQESLVRGQKLLKSHGLKVSLWMPEEGSFISKSSLATLICGMLNTPKGGTIYIGVYEDRTVWGLDLDRSGRDLLRRNLAKIMKGNIHPIVLCPSKVDIDFIPVDCEGGKRATVVVVRVGAFPACGVTWQTPRIYQAKFLAVVEMEGRYIRTEQESSTLNLKMKPMDILKEQKRILDM